MIFSEHRNPIFEIMPFRLLDAKRRLYTAEPRRKQGAIAIATSAASGHCPAQSLRACAAWRAPRAAGDAASGETGTRLDPDRSVAGPGRFCVHECFASMSVLPP
jgi:hypothetical protein